MCGLHWVVAHPKDVHTLVSHEPPLVTLLEDQRDRDQGECRHRRHLPARRLRPGDGEVHPARDAPEPAARRLPGPARARPRAVRAADRGDGSRDDLLLSGNLAMPPFEPDAEALRGSSVRIVPAIGEPGEGSLARRGGEAVARAAGRHARDLPRRPRRLRRQRVVANNDPGAFARSSAGCWSKPQGASAPPK